jgi:hypothetical protein
MNERKKERGGTEREGEREREREITGAPVLDPRLAWQR